MGFCFFLFFFFPTEILTSSIILLDIDPERTSFTDLYLCPMSTDASIYSHMQEPQRSYKDGDPDLDVTQYVHQ